MCIQCLSLPLGHFYDWDIVLCNCYSSCHYSVYVNSWILRENNRDHLEAAFSHWASQGLSTSSSHLMVVALFFGSGLTTYLRPESSHSIGMDNFLSLFYTIVTSTFNPVIYCVRNKDVMVALREFLLKLIVLWFKNINS